ncbi:MAG: S26 family signal peptidase [Bacteroidales bacterium]|nr:S26 family signal peptidase [Bacteroidales bacterium]
MKKLFANKRVKFGIVAFFYLLFVIWLQNWWLLLGLVIIYDIYISKKVHWAFWKKKDAEKQTKTIEWIDALIFAVIAATIIRLFFIEAFTIPTSSMEKSLLVGDYLFVSKLSYGPRMPNTPISVPFAHNTMPFTTSTKSYAEWLQWPYRRLAGLGKVERNDVVVFNFPEGDTVCLNQQAPSYYQLLRQFGREAINNDVAYNNYGQPMRGYFGKVQSRPVDRRENYIKRCVAIAGDSIQVIDGQVYVNGKPQEDVGDRQYKYLVVTDGTSFNPTRLEELGISDEDRKASRSIEPEYLDFVEGLKDVDVNSLFVFPLVEETAEKLRAMPFVKSVTRIVRPKGYRESFIFPHDPKYNWNEDNFGPLYLPKQGDVIKLTLDNLPLYRRCIEVYEGNSLEVKDDQIYINNQPADSYTFRMDYFFMMGDSRHNSADSRFWGFVPEDHVVGKALFIWFSTDKDKSFPASIRWSRIFKGID